MEIKGKLFDILPAQQGKSAKGEWKKQDFIIETEEQFPKKICISNWNDKIDLGKISKGTQVGLSVNIESREFNGKWYTDIKVWKMDIQTISGNSNGNDPQGLSVPPPVAENIPWESDDAQDDGLPF